MVQASKREANSLLGNTLIIVRDVIHATERVRVRVKSNYCQAVRWLRHVFAKV